MSKELEELLEAGDALVPISEASPFNRHGSNTEKTIDRYREARAAFEREREKTNTPGSDIEKELNRIRVGIILLSSGSLSPSGVERTKTTMLVQVAAVSAWIVQTAARLERCETRLREIRDGEYGDGAQRRIAAAALAGEGEKCGE